MELWWLSIVWALVSEVQMFYYNHEYQLFCQVICILYMRDSLVMTLTTILVHSDKLKTWQLAKLPKCEAQGWFISRLFSYYCPSAGRKTQ